MQAKSRKAGMVGKAVAALLFFVLLGQGPLWAWSIVVDGIKVTYPYDFTAYYDEDDGTLTIVIYEDGGKLTVKALPSASYYWGEYVDVYLVADCAYLPSITFKGRWDVNFYITGQVGETYKLSIINGFVGCTDYYGSQGLGNGYGFVPSSISIKNGVACGSVLADVFWACP